MRALDRAHVDYGLRLTATPAAFALLPESVAMLCQESECREMQVEPAFANERGEHSDPTPRQAATFASLFMEAFEVARSYGRLLLYSGARPNLVVSAFCRAAEDALVVTPEGDIVTCYEVHDRRHRLMSRFVIGRATPDAVEIDPDRLRRFAATQNGRRDECAGCFCYWHCAGDCATRCGGAPNDGGGRCEVNRAITRELIAWHIAEGDGVWNGDPLSLDGVPMKLLVRRA
jgi:radical SAM protein with 4Fe4S-binding SPASM domain